MAKKNLTTPPNVFRTQVVGTGLVIAFTLALYMFFVSPRLSEPAKISAAKNADFAKKGALDKQYTELQGLKAKLPAAGLQQNQLVLKFPANTDSIAFESQINAIATASGILGDNLQQINIGQTVFDATGASGTISVEIDLLGSYTQVSNFINKLYTIQRAFQIQSVNLAASQIGHTTSQYTVKITGSIFILKPIAPLPAALLK